MGDDFCREHYHGSNPCTRHHHSPRGRVWRCWYCGSERESVTAADASKRYRDRLS